MVLGPIFAAVQSTSRRGLEAVARSRSYAEGEALFLQGNRPSHMLLLTTGRVKVWRATESGVALTLTLVGPGALIGTLGAAHDRPHAATATALTQVEALTWPLDDLRRLMRQDGALAMDILLTLARYAEQVIERVEEVSVLPLEQRLARTLVRMAEGAGGDGGPPAMDLPLSRQDLADLTSATLPAVSRIMSVWRTDGLIAGRRGRVEILDMNGVRGIGFPAR